MTIGTVTKIDSSTNGKPRIYLDNKHNWPDAIYVGNKCNGIPMLGQIIEASTTSKRFADAKSDTWFLESWKPAVVQQASQPSQPVAQIQTPQINGTYTAPAKPVQGWPDVPTGDLSRFVSNLVGTAIAAGLIKTPSDLAPWTAAAYRAANDLRTGKVRDFDDPVPKFVEDGDPGPDPADGFGDQDDPDSVPF